ncbi:MAG: class I SAM-dependent DNA methyltransferase [Planctomycetota bacterium]|jgi:SAM-dependent methyltransferase
MERKEYKKLHALWYELVSAEEDHGAEIGFWAERIREAGEPALELGSGTGRTYVPLLEQGFDLDGLDTSSDMMSICSAACAARGLNSKLHEQSMLEFSLSREFGIVFLNSGGLGLFTHDGDIRALFERVMEHLRPGGHFIYEFEPVPATDGAGREGPRTRGRRELPDGSILAWRSDGRYDPPSRIWTADFVVERLVDGRATESETNERSGRLFTVEEAVGFGEAAGFTDVKATDWLEVNPPGAASKVITVWAEKPS